MPPWRNPSLITAIAASFIMHFVILYFKITNVSTSLKCTRCVTTLAYCLCQDVFWMVCGFFKDLIIVVSVKRSLNFLFVSLLVLPKKPYGCWQQQLSLLSNFALFLRSSLLNALKDPGYTHHTHPHKFSPLLLTKVNIFALQTIFRITPLNWDEWVAVLYFSFPVIILDEVLKFVSRCIGKCSS